MLQFAVKDNFSVHVIAELGGDGSGIDYQDVTHRGLSVYILYYLHWFRYGVAGYCC